MESPFTFPVARYRFTFEITRPLATNDYAGSMLRGAFGAALRNLACMTREKHCRACMLLHTCPYPRIFESPAETLSIPLPNAPNPYVIEPPPWGPLAYAAGTQFCFHTVLIGRAISDLPFVIHAWQRAFRHDIGRGDGGGELLAVEHITTGGSETIYTPADGSIRSHASEITIDATPASSYTLSFSTPLRLQQDSHPLGPEHITARPLLMAIVRRARAMAEAHASPLPAIDPKHLAAIADRIELRKNLHWRDWTRYSHRQKQKMALGGVTGDIELAGELADFHPYLHLGQWLHAGKNATFGLGQYTLRTW